MKRYILLAFAAICLPTLSRAQNMNPEVRWDRQSLIIGGKRVVPVMGEVHYSRIPAEEWQAEVHKIKEGGVTMIATYVFWNHIEEQQGIFNWSGQRDLRRFIEVCKAEEMPVVLRIGPFCHGEVRCGGIPDWVFSLRQVPSGGGEARPVRARSTDPQFLVCVERYYRQIFAQVQGLQWKDGGPIIACQFDNEYRGPGEYLMALKHLALGIGFDLPFYTRTGWPALTTPVPYGDLLPLYGDYADGFWERSLREGAGSYYKAFNFKAQEKPATDMGAADAANALAPSQADALPAESYPYFTCELGGGMTTAYHRRPYIYPEDAYAMAVVKLGSGSNLLGYYMYHGGTNPESTTGITLHESVHTLATANNDMNVKSYDFQAPLGEFIGLEGDLDAIKAVEFVDQNPIGKSSRSNPVIYVKAYDEIRRLFAEQPLSKQMGFTASHFSFNTEGGRCEECKGEGTVTIEMQFMADLVLECESCHGQRFKRDILDVRFHGRNINDVLLMTVDEAMEFFAEHGEKKIVRRLQPLKDVGLGYIQLGQSSSTLSGGENQRVKLAYYIGTERQVPTMFIFDEPTTGLHYHDVHRLLASFDALIERGHTIVVIEHNLDVIARADHIIDLGPEGGAEGGNVVCAGTPAEVAACQQSYTGRFLRDKLQPRS